jgi:hypothetical protein
MLQAVRTWRDKSRQYLQAVIEDGIDDLALAEMWDSDRRSVSKMVHDQPGADVPSSLLQSLEEELSEMESRASKLLSSLCCESTSTSAGDGYCSLQQ